MSTKIVFFFLSAATLQTIKNRKGARQIIKNGDENRGKNGRKIQRAAAVVLSGLGDIARSDDRG